MEHKVSEWSTTQLAFSTNKSEEFIEYLTLDQHPRFSSDSEREECYDKPRPGHPKLINCRSCLTAYSSIDENETANGVAESKSTGCASTNFDRDPYMNPDYLKSAAYRRFEKDTTSDVESSASMFLPDKS
ncbi:hypothetical protein ACHAQJ_003867 [Trichoderma viride]